MTAFDEKYWTNRYHNSQTGWDVGEITTPLKKYFHGLLNKELRILIPGAGNGYEAAYLHSQGFKNVYMLDLSQVPLQQFAAHNPHFPAEHLLEGDFFDLSDTFDLMVEQTFFCALDPALRPAYVRQAAAVLKPGGRLAGLLFDAPLNDDQPPFGGNREQYLPLFEPHFRIHKFERAYNSIAPRAGMELWIELVKK